ncbi:MAG: hypothetical protein LUH47_03265 [Clostridiales bacterium]|nr:hypothetical protein [Clostridiales bacterium]
MFSVKKVECVTKTFRLPIDLVKEMETVAQSKNISLNNLVTQSCRYAMDNLDEKEKKAAGII